MLCSRNFNQRAIIVMNDIQKIQLKNKIILDSRGWVINPLDIASLAKESLCYFHVVSLKPGSIRGNHYHKNAKEWLLVCEGPAIVAWRSSDDNSICKSLVNKEEPSMYEINQQVEHAILNTSDKDIFLISFCNSEKRETAQCSSLFESNEIH